MKCHYCGAEVKNGETFCLCCGTRQNPAPKAEPAAEKNSNLLPEPDFFLEPEPEEAVYIKPVPQPVAKPEPEQRSAYVPYGAPVQTMVRTTPMIQLPTERGLAKMFFLGIITLGIYPLVIWCKIVTELNIVASRYDGEWTVSYLGAWLLTPITLCTYPFVWTHGLCRRIGAELKRRDIDYKFGPSAFWLWNILGSLILVGPFIFIHKLMKSMNLLNRDFNVRG